MDYDSIYLHLFQLVLMHFKYNTGKNPKLGVFSNPFTFPNQTNIILPVFYRVYYENKSWFYSVPSSGRVSSVAVTTEGDKIRINKIETTFMLLEGLIS